jgi:signal transduction histidine kinase
MNLKILFFMTFITLFFRIFNRIFFLIFLFGTLNIFASINDKISSIDKYSSQLHSQIDTMEWKNVVGYCNSLLKNKKTTPQQSFVINRELSSGYVKMSEYSKALQYSLEALLVAEKINDTFLTAIANSQIGTVYYRLKKYDKSKEHLLSAIRILSKYEDSKYLGYANYKMAIASEDSKDIKGAYDYYMKALKIFEKEGSCRDMADVYNGLASWNYKQRKIEKTTLYANKALEKFLECGEKNDVAAMYTNIAALFNLQKQHNKAIEYNNKAIEIATQIGALNQISEAYLNLSETYSYLNDYKKAYENHVLYDKFNDSIFSLETNKHILELNAKYETAKKEKEISEHKSKLSQKDGELKNTKIITYFLFAIIILAILIAVFIHLRMIDRKKFLNELKKKNDELKDNNDAKDRFFSIISHDLSSPITSFTKIIEVLDSSLDDIPKEELKDYISSLHQSSCNIRLLLNNLLQWSVKQSGHFNPEFERREIGELVNNSFACQCQVAKEKNINILVDKPNDVFVNVDVKMIETVVRNIVSNAVKFSPNNSQININIKEIDDKVEVVIIDRGEGLSNEDIDRLFKIGENTNKIGKDKSQKGSGLGLILCKELLDLNFGEIKAERNEFGGMSFIVKLNKSK